MPQRRQQDIFDEMRDLPEDVQIRILTESAKENGVQLSDDDLASTLMTINKPKAQRGAQRQFKPEEAVAPVASAALHALNVPAGTANAAVLLAAGKGRSADIPSALLGEGPDLTEVSKRFGLDPAKSPRFKDLPNSQVLPEFLQNTRTGDAALGVAEVLHPTNFMAPFTANMRRAAMLDAGRLGTKPGLGSKALDVLDFIGRPFSRMAEDAAVFARKTPATTAINRAAELKRRERLGEYTEDAITGVKKTTPSKVSFIRPDEKPMDNILRSEGISGDFRDVKAQLQNLERQRKLEKDQVFAEAKTKDVRVNIHDWFGDIETKLAKRKLDPNISAEERLSIDNVTKALRENLKMPSRNVIRGPTRQIVTAEGVMTVPGKVIKTEHIPIEKLEKLKNDWNSNIRSWSRKEQITPDEEKIMKAIGAQLDERIAAELAQAVPGSAEKLKIANYQISRIRDVIPEIEKAITEGLNTPGWTGWDTTLGLSTMGAMQYSPTAALLPGAVLAAKKGREVLNAPGVATRLATGLEKIGRGVPIPFKGANGDAFRIPIETISRWPVSSEQRSQLNEKRKQNPLTWEMLLGM